MFLEWAVSVVKWLSPMIHEVVSSNSATAGSKDEIKSKWAVKYQPFKL